MIGIISDVHGNYPALCAVLQELDKMSCKKIISLGDICGYYCMINECIDTFIERNIINIKGNHDAYIINNESCPRSYSANICLAYQQMVITQKNKNWLSKSVDYINIDNLSMVHGGWKNYLDEYIEDFTFLDYGDKKKYISGHTHIQMKRSGTVSDYYNPGSVGQPRDGDARAAYAVIENDKVSLFRVEYDVENTIFVMKEKGFDGRLSECLRYGVKIGQV